MIPEKKKENVIVKYIRKERKEEKNEGKKGSKFLMDHSINHRVEKRRF